MRSVKVRDLCDPHRSQSVIVHGDDPLEDVLRRFAQETALRGIFVEDDEGRLLGVITRGDVLEWARLRLGTAFRGPNLDPDRIVRLSQLVRASLARDAIHPDSQKAAVQLEDPLDEALRTMLEIDLISLPVVDDAGRIVGEVTVSGVLRMLLDVGDETGPSCAGEAPAT